MTQASAKIDLNITEGMISNAIATAMVEAFSPEKKDQVIRDIVRAHLGTKKNSWDRDTLLSASIGDAIKTLAAEAVKEKVASMRPEISAIVDRVMGPRFQDSVLKQIETALSSLAIANIHFKASVVMDGEDE